MADIRQRRFESLPAAEPASVSELRPDHPAMVRNMPLFESTIVDASQSPRVFISGANNRKIGKVVVKGAWKGMPIYTLTLPERMTCPKSCHKPSCEQTPSDGETTGRAAARRNSKATQCRQTAEEIEKDHHRSLRDSRTHSSRDRRSVHDVSERSDV